MIELRLEWENGADALRLFIDIPISQDGRMMMMKNDGLYLAIDVLLVSVE